MIRRAAGGGDAGEAFLDGSDFLRRMGMGPQEQGRVLAELQPFVVMKAKAVLQRYRAWNPDDASDLVQEVNEEFLVSWMQFRGDGVVEAWLGRIIERKAIDRLRRGSRFVNFADDDESTADEKLAAKIDAHTSVPATTFIFERSCLGLALAALAAAPPARKGSMRAFDLIAFLIQSDGPDAQELAEFLATTRHAAVERRSQVLKKLRETCERVCGRDDCELPMARSAA